MEDINRIKIVLFEKTKIARWLAGELVIPPPSSKQVAYKHATARHCLLAKNIRSIRSGYK